MEETKETQEVQSKATIKDVVEKNFNTNRREFDREL